MHYPKCNEKINNNGTYCSNCRNKTETKEKSSRAFLKKNAKSIKKKPLIITTLIFMALCAILEIIFKVANKIELTLTASIIFTIITLIIALLLTAIYTFDMYGGSIKISRGIKLTPTQVLKKFTKRPKYSISVILITLIAGLIACLITITIMGELLEIFIPAFIVIIIVLVIYIYPIFEMLLFALSDEKNKNKKILECIKEAIELPKGKRLEFYGLQLSFFWWHILALITLGILYIWLYPYIVLAEANLYRKWNGEVEFLSEKEEISNPIIVLLTVFAGIFIGTMIYIFLPAYESLSTDEYATLVLDNKKITFKVPNNCKLVLEGDTDDYSEYTCNDNDYIIYSLSYHFQDDFKDAENSTKKDYEEEFSNVKVSDYKTKINGKETKIFYIDYKPEKKSEETYRDTFVFYRLNNYIDAQITITMNDVTKENLTDYIKIEKEESL